MANHKIPLPTDFRDVLSKQVTDIARDQLEGRLPEYRVFVNNLFKAHDLASEELIHATIGMSGEAGELLDISKKVWVYGKELDLAHLVEELGDLRFYYQATLNMFGLTDDDIRAANMVKLRKRYAEGVYSDKAAIARADKQPQPLSADGTKGTRAEEPIPRKFMGQQDDSGKSVDNEPDPMDPEREKVRAMLERVAATEKAAEGDK